MRRLWRDRIDELRDFVEWLVGRSRTVRDGSAGIDYWERELLDRPIYDESGHRHTLSRTADTVSVTSDETGGSLVLPIRLWAAQYRHERFRHTR